MLNTHRYQFSTLAPQQRAADQRPAQRKTVLSQVVDYSGYVLAGLYNLAIATVHLVWRTSLPEQNQPTKKERKQNHEQR
jgi:hypothetical protein